MSTRLYRRDAKLLIAVTGSLAASFFGVQMLLKVLYILRLGHGPKYVGWFTAASALAYMSMGLPSGALGNRFGTRLIMRIGSLATVAGMALLPVTEYLPAWAHSFWPFVSQIVLTVGWSMFNVNLVPTLTAATAADERSSAFALSSAVRGIGTFVGTIVGGLLPEWFATMLGQTLDAPAPYRFALWIGAVLGFVGATPLFFVRESLQTGSRETWVSAGSLPLLPILLMAGYVYLRHAGWATCQAFCNAYMDSDLGLRASSIGLITGVGQILAVVSCLVTPRLVARWSNARVLMMTTLGTAISLIPLGASSSWVAAGGGRIGVLILSAIWMPALQVFQMELVDERWRSIAYGAVSMAMGLGYGSTSFAGGYVIASWGYRHLFLVGVVISLLSAFLMWLILRRYDDNKTS